MPEPQLPMIAIVLRSRSDFNRSLINEVQIHDSRIAGFYSRITNRITTFDPDGYVRTGEDRWMYGSTSVIHEATHQSAFNTGIHNRFAPPPTWLSEGLATMFESAGRNTDAAKPQLGSNGIRLNQLRKYLGTDVIHAGLVNLVANDRMFRSHPELAYALSWGMSYYLAKTKPEKYFKFLQEDGRRQNFSAYPEEKRLRDFMKAFGHDFHQLEDELNQYFLQR